MNPDAWAVWWRQFEGRSLDGTDEPYDLQSLIGAGGFGAVFRARLPQSNKLLALKIILVNEQVRDQQLRELVRGLKLQNAGLITCVDAGSSRIGDTPVLYLAMELAEGTLQDRMAQGPLRLEEASLLAAQLSETLDYLHNERRLVHRDLKPANILWAGGRWKLADLGITRPVGPGTSDRTEVVMGSGPYMPPESFEGVVSPAWDLWSLGVMLAQALTGKAPFTGENDMQLMAAICMQPPIISAPLPTPFDRLIRCCLEKDRGRRCTARQARQMLQADTLRRDAERIKASGQQEQALAMVTEALALDPQSPELTRMWEAITNQLAEQRRREQDALLKSQIAGFKAQGKLLEAIRTAREWQQLDPDDSKRIAQVQQLEREYLDQQIAGGSSEAPPESALPAKKPLPLVAPVPSKDNVLRNTIFIMLALIALFIAGAFYEFTRYPPGAASVQQGNTAFVQMDYLSALKSYATALKEAPENQEAANGLQQAKALLLRSVDEAHQTGHYDIEVKGCDAILAALPDDPDAMKRKRAAVALQQVKE